MSSPPPGGWSRSDELAGMEIFFGLVGSSFIITPLLIMFARFVRFPSLGVSAMFSPMPTMSRRRALASQFRSYLYAHSPWGYWLDLGQAVCSAISCLLFIIVAYTSVEYDWVTDLEVSVWRLSARWGAGVV